MAEFHFRAPRYAHLPHLHTMLDSIGNDLAVSRLLGLTPATIKKYRKAGQAPRPVMFALFWETPWGRETVEVALINEARSYYSLNLSLKRENSVLRKQVEALEQELSSGASVAANHTFFHVGR